MSKKKSILQKVAVHLKKRVRNRVKKIIPGQVTVLNLEEEEGSSKRTAQTDIKKMRQEAGKKFGQPVMEEDYARTRGYTMEQALRALGRPQRIVPPIV